jgi:hypothetical protein
MNRDGIFGQVGRLERGAMSRERLLSSEARGGEACVRVYQVL